MRRRPLPLLLSATPFTVREAPDYGVTESRLRGSDLTAPFSGLRVSATALPIEHRSELYLPLLDEAEVFSHLTAAQLWGLPLPLGVGTELHVTRFGCQRPRRPGVVGHRSSARLPATLLHGVPVTAPVRTWAQCSEVLDVGDLVAMGDALAGRWSPYEQARGIPVERMAAAVDSWGARRGCRRLRQAFELVRPNVWSPKETELRLMLTRGGIPEPPGLNAEVTDAAGCVLGHGDLVWPDRRLVVEYEGDQHRTDRAQWRHDVAKYEQYTDAGWRVVRVTDDDLVSPAILLARIAGLLARRALE